MTGPAIDTPTALRRCPKCLHPSAVHDPGTDPPTWTCPHDRCHGTYQAFDANENVTLRANGPYTFRLRTDDDR